MGEGFLLGFITCLVLLLGWFWWHQRLLRSRSELMEEAIRNKDFTFRLPVKEQIFGGERALQETLNRFGVLIQSLLSQNEVESWERMTRVLTHEIMNSAAPIVSISDVFLRRKDVKESPLYDGIKAIHDTSTGLISFVDGFRKLSALQKPVPTEFGLADFLRQFTTLYPEVEWTIEANADCRLCTDEGLLRQVVINMVKNAIEAEAHKIYITAEQDDNRMVLKISNDGAPIPTAEAREIFIPFFTTKRSGNGIGLSLSRRILVLQGGSLELQEHAEAGYHVTFVLGIPFNLFYYCPLNNNIHFLTR